MKYLNSHLFKIKYNSIKKGGMKNKHNNDTLKRLIFSFPEKEKYKTALERNNHQK